MKKYFYSLFSLLILSISLSSCSTEDELISPIKKGIKSKNYEAALIAADSALIKQPENGLVYYYRADLLSRIAQNEPIIAKRQPIFAEVHQNLVTAKEKFDAMDNPPTESKLIFTIINRSWSEEHNAAIGYATNDSLKASVEKPLKIAISHLINATTVNPDSALSHDVISQIYYMDEDYTNAASSLETAIKIYGTKSSAENYDRLASYYFMTKDFSNALSALDTGLEIYPDSVFLIQKKADALFQTGETEAALSVVNELIERDPTNAQYHLVIGSQIYNRVQLLIEGLETNNDTIYELKNNNGAEDEISLLKSRNTEMMSEIELLTNKAEASLLTAAKIDNENIDIFNTLGVLYQNKASGLFDLRDITTDNEEANRLDKLAKTELEKAMVNYEKTVQLDLENKSIWESLFRIYTILNYPEKATDAMNRANM